MSHNQSSLILPENSSYLFEDRELHKLSEEKLEILVEQNIIDEGTALALVI